MPCLITTVLAFTAGITAATAAAVPSTPTLLGRDFKTCPGLNGATYTTPRGTSTWKIDCDQDTFSNGGQEKTVQADDFEDCINRCNNPTDNRWCDFAAFSGKVNEPGPCYMKKGNGGGYSRKEGVKLAIRL